MTLTHFRTHTYMHIHERIVWCVSVTVSHLESWSVISFRNENKKYNCTNAADTHNLLLQHLEYILMRKVSMLFNKYENTPFFMPIHTYLIDYHETHTSSKEVERKRTKHISTYSKHKRKMDLFQVKFSLASVTALFGNQSLSFRYIVVWTLFLWRFFFIHQIFS